MRDDPAGWEYIERLGIVLPQVRTSGVTGVVEVIDCVDDHPSDWVVRAVRLNRAGIPTGVLIAPLILASTTLPTGLSRRFR